MSCQLSLEGHKLIATHSNVILNNVHMFGSLILLELCYRLTGLHSDNLNLRSQEDRDQGRLSQGML